MFERIKKRRLNCGVVNAFCSGCISVMPDFTALSLLGPDYNGNFCFRRTGQIQCSLLPALL
jgi:hypothetical protein